MKVNYVLMYGTPYLKYREFETFEDISKFLVNKSIVNYSIFKKLEDKEEVEMIYRDSDIRVLEDRINKTIEYCNETIKYMELLEEGDANIQTIKEVINILKRSEE
jgi:hypothetical protein